MLDVIIYANFGVEKLRGLGNTVGQILESSIEMHSLWFTLVMEPQLQFNYLNSFDCQITTV